VTEPKPLSGRRIVVTRPRHQAESLKNALAALGADVVVAPAIRIEPPADWAPLDFALASADDYDWIVFTSVNGVEAFFDRIASTRHSKLASAFAAIGPATAEALSARGVEATVVPERFLAEEVFEALSRHTELSGKKILLPRADIAREALPKLLKDAGADVDVVARPHCDRFESGLDIVVGGSPEDLQAATLIASTHVTVTSQRTQPMVRSLRRRHTALPSGVAEPPLRVTRAQCDTYRVLFSRSTGNGEDHLRRRRHGLSGRATSSQPVMRYPRSVARAASSPAVRCAGPWLISSTPPPAFSA